MMYIHLSNGFTPHVFSRGILHKLFRASILLFLGYLGIGLDEILEESLEATIHADR